MPMRDEPPPEAYGRVTNPERFRVLHPAMADLLDRLERDYDVHREERYGIDEELEHRQELPRPGVRLTPADSGAAQLVVVFTSFPGLALRLGNWWTEYLPACGCDACGDSGDDLAEELTALVSNLTEGRFHEGYDPRSGRSEGWIWGGGRKRGRQWPQNSPSSAYRNISWKPWPRRADT